MSELQFVHLPMKNKIVTKIHYFGNSFIKSKITKCSTYWYCDRAKVDACRARITVSNVTGEYRITNSIHTHQPTLY